MRLSTAEHSHEVHFIFAGTAAAKGGGTVNWKTLLRAWPSKTKVLLHYSSFAAPVWESFESPLIEKVVHDGWRTWENRNYRHFDDSWRNFKFDTIPDEATVFLDSIEAFRQLTPGLYRKKCRIFWHIQSPERLLRKNPVDTLRDLSRLRMVAGLVFVSAYARKKFESDIVYRLLNLNIPSSVIYNGVELKGEVIEPVNNYVVYLGRFEAYKNPLFLESVSVHARYVGSTEGCTVPVAVPSERDLGWMEDKDRIAELGNVFIVPSIGEAFGLVLIEMMSRGKIVIAFDSGAFPEIIENGKNGFLIAPFDSRRAKEIIATLEREPANRLKIQEEAVIRAAAFGVDVFTNAIHRLLVEM